MDVLKYPIREKKENALSIIKDGIEYVLPEAWSLSDSGTYSFRNKLSSRAFAHGSDMTGDGKLDGRTITVTFSMHELTEQEHDEVLNQAYTYFTQTDFDLKCGRTDRVYHVAGLSRIRHSYQNGFKQRWSSVTVSLLLADPFRYEAQQSKAVFKFDAAAKDAMMVLHNLGSVDTPLTFRLIPKDRAGNISVWHQEAVEKFTLNDSLLISPATCTVNGKEGTVWRDSANAINTFGGTFLSAKPGANHFYYTGGAMTIEITFTNRWFI